MVISCNFSKRVLISLSKGGVIKDSSVGDYRFIDDTHVRIDVKLFDITVTEVLEVSISNNELTVTTVSGDIEKYTRVG